MTRLEVSEARYTSVQLHSSPEGLWAEATTAALIIDDHVTPPLSMFWPAGDEKPTTRASHRSGNSPRSGKAWG